ncbi:MAG TPA: hypothetical protein VER33_06955 [Polyangiaceae bacterium]|nr:hypothetical protein [Polyangiaceae bacterium]
MFYLFLLAVAAIGFAIYLLFFLNNVPGAMEERLGVHEALPADVGQWSVDSESEQGRLAAAEGLRREVRTFFEESKGRLLRQVRYRNAETNAIVRVEPDEVMRRRRVKPAG